MVPHMATMFAVGKDEINEEKRFGIAAASITWKLKFAVRLAQKFGGKRERLLLWR